MKRARRNSDVTDTPAFRRWFGHSKVVDADGQPLPVYHGTFSDFSAFDYQKSRGINRLGFWFDAAVHIPNVFAGGKKISEFGGSGSVVPVYLSLQKPKEYWSDPLTRDEYESLETLIWGAHRQLDGMDFPETPVEQIIRRDAKKLGMRPVGLGDLGVRLHSVLAYLRIRGWRDAYTKMLHDLLPESETAKSLSWFLDNVALVEAARERLAKQHDGVILHSTLTDTNALPYVYWTHPDAYRIRETGSEVRYFGNDWYLALYPTQIKSATGNRGTFDSADPDIRHNPRALKSRGRTLAERGMPTKWWHGTKTQFEKIKPQSSGCVWLADRAGATEYATPYYSKPGHRWLLELDLAPDTSVVELADSSDPIVRAYIDMINDAAKYGRLPYTYEDWAKQDINFGILETERWSRSFFRKYGVDALIVRDVAGWGGHEAMPSLCLLNTKKIQQTQRHALDNPRRGRKNPTVRAEIDTPAFRRWFGDSKVVDKHGKPRVMYHGTASEFWAFDPSTQGRATDAGTLGAGFYFTSSREAAQSYADDAARKYGGTPRVVEVYLRISKPYRAPRRLWQLSHEPKEARKHSAALRKQKYDGIQFHVDLSAIGDASFDEYVVFDPRQIKSATDNRGTFDPADPDIRHNPRRARRNSSGTDTLAFRRWFDGSKVVDANGKPQVVYHGTKAQFTVFDLRKVKSDDIGFHFGTAKQAKAFLRGQGARKISAFLRLKNPLRLYDTGRWEPYDVWNSLTDLRLVPYDDEIEERFSVQWVSDRKFEAAEYVRGLMARLGYDGIVYLNRREGLTPKESDMIWELEEEARSPFSAETDALIRKKVPAAQDSYIVFDPSQIKSVDNVGTFDPADPDIRHNPRRARLNPDYANVQVLKGRIVSPEGSIPVRKIGEGAFSTVYLSEEAKPRVFAVTSKRAKEKEILAQAYALDPKNPHLPQVSRYGSTKTGKTVWTMPYYTMLGKAKEATEARNDAKALTACRTATLKRKSFHPTTSDEINEAIVACAESSVAVRPQLVRALDALRWAARLYQTYLFEFQQRNLAVDEKGRLILLDVIFDWKA